MKNTLRILLTMFVLNVPTALAVVLEVVPESSTVDLGSTAALDVHVSGLGDGAADSLGVYDLDVTFDSTLFSFVGATFGAGLDVFGFGSLQVATVSAEAVNLFELSFDFAEDLDFFQPGAFDLVTLTFEAIGTGIGAFGIEVNSIGDGYGAALAASTFGASMTVVGVPTPASALTLLVGLIMLFKLVGSKSGFEKSLRRRLGA